ncbi:uncharacterized protein LOC122460818 [Dermochelys coriacea]|uniref:uncharacterized protein LOC122460818 n=1 Tax=Dermochelys coriacea TaxID=27794 RepID=UPI001CA96A98|nr:uncharacterized protein LOC122460818 [Dermochelys coriacea]
MLVVEFSVVPELVLDLNVYFPPGFQLPVVPELVLDITESQKESVAVQDLLEREDLVASFAKQNSLIFEPSRIQSGEDRISSLDLLSMSCSTLVGSGTAVPVWNQELKVGNKQNSDSDLLVGIELNYVPLKQSPVPKLVVDPKASMGVGWGRKGNYICLVPHQSSQEEIKKNHNPGGGKGTGRGCYSMSSWGKERCRLLPASPLLDAILVLGMGQLIPSTHSRTMVEQHWGGREQPLPHSAARSLVPCVCQGRHPLPEPQMGGSRGDPHHARGQQTHGGEAQEIKTKELMLIPVKMCNIPAFGEKKLYIRDGDKTIPQACCFSAYTCKQSGNLAQQQKA